MTAEDGAGGTEPDGTSYELVGEWVDAHRPGTGEVRSLLVAGDGGPDDPTAAWSGVRRLTHDDPGSLSHQVLWTDRSGPRPGHT